MPLLESNPRGMPEVSTLVANRLLSCPACGASDFSAVDSLLVCLRCNAEHRVDGGVVDFVGGRLETSLDAIDYDDYYGVDHPKMARVFELVREHAGSVLARPPGSILELGAGTGLLTAGLVRARAAERLLVTDVSPKMLGICRTRVQSVVPEAPIDLCFATNDGISLGARKGEFDVALGYFVVHHILEWRRTLRAVLEATNETGMAVFVEPNRRFHTALVLVMNRVLERLLPEMPDLPGSDLSLLLNLVSEWDFTLKYTGQTSALAHQEDKHFFDRSEFEAACRSAGWAFAVAQRFDSRTGPLETAKVYASQLKLTPKGSERFLEIFSSELPGPFALLDEVDASPSYVFFMGKRAEDAALCPATGSSHDAAPVELGPPPKGYAVVCDLSVTVDGATKRVTVEGWIAGARPVMRVVLWFGAFRVSALVGTRRVDVVRGMARLRRHPFANLLHSGIRSLEAPGPASNEPANFDAVRIVAEFDDGRALTLVEAKKLERTPSGALRTRVSVLD